MSLSIRNQLPGTVTTVTPGEAMATVRVRLSGGQDVTAAITRDAADDLALAPGTAVHALVKSTEVSRATGRVAGLSIRNPLPGTVTPVPRGVAMATVRVRHAGGQDVPAAFPRAAADDLARAPGTAVHALVTSTEVSRATGRVEGLSIRNRLPGTVTALSTGAAMASVQVAVEGAELTAAITRDAADDLGLAVGAPVVALVKSTEVSLATV